MRREWTQLFPLTALVIALIAMVVKVFRVALRSGTQRPRRDKQKQGR